MLMQPDLVHLPGIEVIVYIGVRTRVPVVAPAPDAVLTCRVCHVT
jgi:hypothetical protein